MIDDSADMTIFEIFSEIVSNPKVLWFEVSDYTAIKKFESFVQEELGERGHGTAKTMKIATKIVSGCGVDKYRPDNIIVTMLRDVSTRAEDDSYGVTTRVVASLSDKQRIDFVKVAFRGEKGHQIINLKNRFMFPELTPEQKNYLSEELYKLRELEAKINAADSKITALKKQLKSDDESILKYNGLTLKFEEPKETEALCDLEGNRVKQEKKILLENGVYLFPLLVEKFTGYKNVEVEELPQLMWEKDCLTASFKKKAQDIRWMELSVIERLNSDQTITVFGNRAIEFEVCRTSKTVYDYTPEVVQGTKDGKYVKMKVAGTRGKWVLTGTPKLVYSLSETKSNVIL